jgi:hypothetical protein
MALNAKRREAMNNEHYGEAHVGTLAQKMGQGDKLKGTLIHGLDAQMRQGTKGYKRSSQAYEYIGRLMKQGGK